MTSAPAEPTATPPAAPRAAPPTVTPTTAGADRDQLRAALLTRPAAATAVAGVLVAAVAAALDTHPVAAAVSALVGAAVVLATSAVTGLLGVRTAAARAEAVFAAAMASFAGKVLVFAVALGVVGHVAAARRIPFALSAIVAVLVWLMVEVAFVARLRSAGAAVFGPPTRRAELGVPGDDQRDGVPTSGDEGRPPVG